MGSSLESSLEASPASSWPPPGRRPGRLPTSPGLLLPTSPGLLPGLLLASLTPPRTPPGLLPASSLASEEAPENPGYHGLRKTFPEVGGSGEATINCHVMTPHEGVRTKKMIDKGPHAPRYARRTELVRLLVGSLDVGESRTSGSLGDKVDNPGTSLSPNILYVCAGVG